MVTELLGQVEAAVKEANDKKIVADTASLEAKKAVDDYHASAQRVEELRNKINESLGGMFADTKAGRVRQS